MENNANSSDVGYKFDNTNIRGPDAHLHMFHTHTTAPVIS